MKMEPIVIVVPVLLTVLGLLFRWLHIQSRDNKIALELIMKTMYTKEETNDRIDLKLKPIEVGIEHVQKDVVEIKHMIGRLLDEKNAS